MTTKARDVLKTFETLSPADQQEIAVEILRRRAGTGEISEAAFNELADEVFCAYDAEEDKNAKR
jgi:uncharacterized membrane protein